MNREILDNYITGRASEDERDAIAGWLREDRTNLDELTTLRRLHDIGIWNHHPPAVKAGNRRRIAVAMASAAAVLIVLLCANLYLLSQTVESVMQTVNVPPGQRVELILGDGTKVWLNAGSTFNFPSNFSGNSREVVLDGEAYFDVKKEEKRSFIVKTSGYAIRALGTTFNVTAYRRSDGFEVSLLTGSVEISPAGKDEKVVLEPSERVYLENSRLVKSPIVQYNNFLWKEGIIFFDNEPFEKMMAKLELYFDVRIIIGNTPVKAGKYTGKFRTKDGIEHILRVIRRKEQFVYEKALVSTKIHQQLT